MKRLPAMRWWARALLLGAVCFPSLVCVRANGQAPPAAAQGLLDKAHSLEALGRLDLASQVWGQVLITDPNNTEALGGKLRAAKSAGNAALYSTYLERLRAINPNDPGIERAERMNTAASNQARLKEAERLARQGQYGQAMTIYREIFGTEPPPGDTALAYYETESATEDGRGEAIKGLRDLAQKYPNDNRYQVALGQILTYNPRTRAEGRHLLEGYPSDPTAVAALRQSLLWDAQNPATAGDIRSYLARHPDPALAAVLRNEPKRAGGAAATAEQRAAAAVYAARGVEARAAYRSLAANHLEDAEKQFKAMLAKNPDEADALAGMGYIRMQQANFGGAISFLVQAKSDGSKDPGVENALSTARFWYTMGEGSAALNAGDLGAAEREYRQALEMKPASVEAMEGLGGTLLKAQRPDAAMPIFAEFVKLKPSAPHAWRGLFLARFGAGEASAALETERTMPASVRAELMKDPLYLQSLASAYSAMGQDAEAQRVLRGALELPFPSNGQGVQTETTLQYAALLQQANRLDQAGSLYRQVLTKEPANVAAYQGLIREEHAAGQDGEALKNIEAMSPELYAKAMRDSGFNDTVASIYQSQGRLDVAQEILEKSLRQQSGDGGKPSVAVRIQLAGIYLQRGNTAQAFPLYQQVLAQHPADASAWKGLVDALHTAGRDEEALAGARQIPAATRAQLENDVSYLQSLASIYGTLDQPAEAKVFLRRVQDHYAELHTAPPADVDLQDAWLLYNGMDDTGLWQQLMSLGARQDLSDKQRRTVQTIWADFAVRRANQAATGGDKAGSLAILNATAQSFADNLQVLRALAGGYASAGMMKQSVAIWRSMDLTSGTVDDYKSAVGAALAAGDQKDAETWLRFGLNQYPENSGLLIVAAKFEERRGDVKRAEAYYHDALSKLPKDHAGPALASALSATPSGSGRSAHASADLSQLLAPGRTRVADASNPAIVPAPPYLPGSSGQTVLPRWPDEQLSLGTERVAPRTPAKPDAERHHAPAAQPQLGDYVPQAALDQRTLEWIGDGPVEPSPSDAMAYDLRQQALQPVSTQAVPASASEGSSAVVYGAYVPYVPPTKRMQTQEMQARAQPVALPIPQMTTRPQSRDTVQPLNGTGSMDEAEVFGQYVPYVPPARAAVTSGGAGSRPPDAPYSTMQYPQPAKPRVAAAARREMTAGASRTGVSEPPEEDYSTTAAGPAGSAPVGSATSLYLVPAAYIPALRATGQSQGQIAVPQATGDSSAQQYPQPRTAPTSSTSRKRQVRRKAVAPAAERQAERTPSPSYPGTGSPLGYQPYPMIGPAHPLPAAPTDYDLLQKQVPALRGGAYTGELLASQVPLTERQQAERELAVLEGSYSGWLGGTAGARYRSGIIGYDRLTDLETTFEASYVAANSVRFSVVPKAVFLDSGQLDVTNDLGVAGSPVLGTFNTGKASYDPSLQSSSGLGGEFQVTAKRFAAAAGYTPYEFLVQNYTGRVLFRPTDRFTLFANRDAVTETQLSYAGLRDPGSASAVFPGNIWGGVVSTGGGVRLDLGNEKAGFYASADGAHLTGYHVLANNKFEGSAGAYFLAHTFPEYGRLNVGVSMFGMHYSANERPLSYGLGGYFSPHAYFLASVPVSFAGRYGNNFHYTINGSIGVQTFQENSQLYFPLDRAIETRFQTLQYCVTPQVVNHTCGQYPTNSNTGGNYSANAEGAYRVGEHWFAGGFFAANNTNNYNTVTAGFFVRYLIRPQTVLEDYPTGLFPVEGFRPVRVP